MSLKISHSTSLLGEHWIRVVTNPPHNDFLMALEEEEAARRILSHPDLLRACKEALARIESDIESPNMKTSEGDLCRAAIAKAEAKE